MHLDVRSTNTDENSEEDLSAKAWSLISGWSRSHVTDELASRGEEIDESAGLYDLRSQLFDLVDESEETLRDFIEAAEAD